MQYEIRYADGRQSVICATCEEAVEILESECEVVEEFADRWLAWATDEDSENDDGSRSVAQITRVEEES